MIKNPRTLAGDEIKCTSLSVDLNIDPLSTASMTLPGGETIAPRTYVELFVETGSVGYFRTRAPQQGIAQSSNIPLDHAIAEAGDSIVNADIEEESTVSAAISKIWTYYKGSKWQLGNIASNAAVTLNVSYDSVLDAILDVLSQAPSLMLTYNFDTTPWTVNVAEREGNVSAEGRITRNVKSARITPDDSELCTRVYMEHLPGATSSQYGHMDADTISLYGVVEKELGGDDTQAQATRIASAYLEKHKHPIYAVEIDALDLSKTTGEPLDQIAIGKKYRLALPKYGVIVEETVTSMRYTSVFGNPKSVSVVLSQAPDQVINYIRKNARASRSTTNIIKKQNAEYRTIFDQQDEYIALWAGKANENGSILWQAGLHLDPNGILQYATDDEKYVAAKMNVMADQIRSEVGASGSRLYSYVQQTASNIRSEIADTEQGIRNYVNQTASGTHQVIISTTNQTWIQDKDPTTPDGGSHSPKEGDVWVESTHHGTWDGAEGFDWEHDEDYDWTQVQGAKIWGWANDKWELVSDQQQTVTYAEVIDAADYYVQQRFKQIVDDEGNISIYTAKLQETARSIRAEVSAANSTIYSSIVATATNVLLRAKERPRVTYSKTQPTDLDGRGLKEEDVWIQTENQKNWDAAFNFSWDDDSGIDWNALRSDKIKVYKDGDWVDVLDGTTLVEESDVDIDRKRTKIYAKKLEKVDGQLQAYYAELKVDAKQIKSTVDERYNQLGSSITQTAREIRSEVHAANSQVYSSITQTASHIRSEVANEITGVRSSIQQTANSIRSDVSAANSTIYSRITQTAQSIRTEVNAANSLIYSSITQTANGIRTDVGNEFGNVRTSIQQTANAIRSEVNAANSMVYSSIQQTASSIRSEVASSISGVSSQITQTANSIRSDVNAANSAIYSSIQQTASGIRSEVADSISGVRSEISQTASSWSAKISGVVDENGNVTAASIAVAINASTGESEAKIDAQRVYIGNQKSSTVIAGKATLSDVTADYIKTQIASLAEVTMLAGYAGSFRVNNGNGQAQDVSGAIWDLWIEQSGNTYTLKRKRISDGDWVEVGSFSRATSLSGAWGSGQLTVTASPQGTTWSCGLGARFTSGGGGYYIEAYRNEGGSVASIPDTSTQISLARSGATVMVVDRNGHQIGNTPTLTMTTHSKCKANLIGEVKIGGQRGKVKMYYKDGTTYKEVFSSSYYWYYSDSYADLATYYS